jgi:hypothetical protein
MSTPKVVRALIYAELGVAEIWRYAPRKALVIEQLQAEGSYAAVESSRFLPIRALEIVGWLTADDSGNEPAWNRCLNQWATE